MADSSKPPAASVKGRGIVLTMAVILIAATVVVGILLLGAQTKVEGYVLDGEGQPIAGATVSSGSSSTTTGPDGSFELTVLTVGKVVVMASAEGHWSQKLDLAPLEEGKRQMDFTLIEDVQAFMPLGVVFLHLKDDTGLNGTVTVWASSPGQSRGIRVDDWASGDGEEFEWAEAEGATGNAISIWALLYYYNGSSFIPMIPVTVSGVYWDTPGQCENCFVRSASGLGLVQPEMSSADYLTLVDAQGVEATLVQSGVGRTFQNSPSGSYELVEELGVHASAIILGQEFNCTLRVTFGPASDDTPYINVELVNESSSPDPVQLKVLVEGGHIVHIWEL